MFIYKSNRLQRILALIVIVVAVKCEILITNDESKNVRCYPSRFDMNKIYKSLSNLIYYFWDNRSIIDISMYLGLFLTRVHLRSAFALCNASIYNHLEVDIFELINNVTMSMDFFAAQYINDKAKDKQLFVQTLLLFIEDGTWYNGDLAMKINPVTTFETQTEDQFNDYIKELYDYSETEPSWHYLSKCLGHLSHTKYQFPTGTKGCPLTWVCHAIYKPNPSGPQGLGFSMTRKVAFLLMSKHSRPCNVTVFREDLLEKFCQRMYLEAITNYKHGLKLINVLTEQMAVCSMHGKGDMLFKKWLFMIMKHQVRFGCLQGNNYSREYHNNKLDVYGSSKFNPYGSLPNYGQGACNRHLTTTFMVALAGAFRYVVQSPDTKQGNLCKFYYDKINEDDD